VTQDPTPPTCNHLTGAVHGAAVQAGSIGSLSIHLPTPAGDGPIPHELPPPGRFVDREDDRRALTDMLIASSPSDRPRASVAVLIGPGGMGKSALARHWGHQNADAFPDGQVYADFTATGAGPEAIGDVLEQFLRTLGVPPAAIPSGIGPRAARWRTLTHNLRLLVMIDGVDAQTDVRPLLPASSTSVTVLTARHAPPELVGDGAWPYLVRPLPEQAAAELLTHCAGEQRASREQEALLGLARMSGGHALTLALASAQLTLHPHRPVSHVLAAVSCPDDQSSNITTAWRNILMATTDDLPPDARTLLALLRALPRYPGAQSITVTLAEADALLDTTVIGDGGVHATLYRLIDRHLVDETATAGLYTVPAMVLAHSDEFLPAEALTAALQRLANYYRLRTAQAVLSTEPGKVRYSGIPENTLRPFSDREAALRWVLQTRPNLVALHQLCVERGWDELAVGWACVLWPMLRQTGHLDDQLVVQSGAAVAAERLKHPYLPLAHARAGWALEGLGRFEESVRACTRAVQTTSLCDNPLFALAAAVSTRSTAYFRLDQLESALQDINTAIDADRTLGSPAWVIGLRLRRRAHILLKLGQHDLAMADSDEAVKLTRSDLRRMVELARACQSRAQVCIALGHDEEAMLSLTTALGIFKAHSHPLHRGEVHLLLGGVHERGGRFEQAVAHYKAAHAAYADIGHDDKARAASDRALAVMVTPHPADPHTAP
jgi:tetratricopeptide (TPR) repeat protein